MRGVHTNQVANTKDTKGSSPHARGPLWINQSSGKMFGIIPACAGSIPFVNNFFRGFQDHPRMRGVHLHLESVASH